MQRPTQDIASGLVFLALGVFFSVAVLVTPYRVGTPLEMGPGYFPLILGGLLTLLGMIVIVRGLLASEREVIGAIPWRAIGLVTVAVAFFGLTVRGLGLVPALFAAILLSTLAARRSRLPETLLITTGLTVMIIVIFVALLRLPLRLIGPWIPL
jgi:hypothetical protein